MLIISILIYLVSSIVVCDFLFHKFSLSKLLLTFFVLTYALNVITAELLSLFHLLNNQWMFLLAQLIFCSVIVFILVRTRKISLREIVAHFASSFKDFRACDYALLTVIAGILIGMFIIGISTPPDNMDSLHTHYLRIYYWLQHGSLENWPATGLYQLTYPINTNLQGLWLFLMSHNDNTFFLVQWFSLAVIGAASYEISRLLGFKSTSSLLAVLVFLSFPAALLQAYSFQGDLTVTALVMVCIFLIFSYTKNKELYEMLGAMLVLSLALGAKQTAFFTLPAICLFIGYMLITKQLQKKHIPLLALIFVFFLVFSSFKYIQNYVSTGTIVGESDPFSKESVTGGSVFEKLEYNLPRYFYQYISFDGVFRQPQEALIKVKAFVFEKITSFSHLDLQSEKYLPAGFSEGERFSYTTIPAQSEDTTWFGPLCFSLCFLGFLVACFRKDKTTREYLIFALVYNIIYVLILVIQRPGWHPYHGRYFLLGVMPFVPLIAAVIPSKRKAGIPIGWIIAVFAVCLSASTVLFNTTKPVVTLRTANVIQSRFLQGSESDSKIQQGVKFVFNGFFHVLKPSLIPRQDIMDSNYYELLFYNCTYTIPEIEFINPHLTDTTPLYLIMNNNVLEYALFGKNMTRTLNPVASTAEVPAGGYLVLENSKTADLSDFTLLETDNIFSLYQRNP